LRLAQVIVRHREIPPRLAQVHFVNAVAHGVNHVQLRHGLRQKWIAVAPGCLVAAYVIGRLPFVKRAFALKHKTVRLFDDDYTPIARVVLVGNAVVQCLQHNFPVVLGDLDGHQLVVRQDAQRQIAYFLVELSGGQQKRGREVHVRPLLAFQLQGHLRRVGRQTIGRLSLP
jgi:hypothetical protein